MKASRALVERWKEKPRSRVSLIVHIRGDASEYVEKLSDLGLSVVREFRLTNTIAVRGTASRALDLLQKPWVVRVEPDRKITTKR
jgi:hypothetical protein